MTLGKPVGLLRPQGVAKHTSIRGIRGVQVGVPKKHLIGEVLLRIGRILAITRSDRRRIDLGEGTHLKREE